MFHSLCRLSLTTSFRISARQIHSSTPHSYPRRSRNERKDNDGGDGYDVDSMPLFDDDDATSAAHLMIQQQKQMVEYLRLIERDTPLLKRLRSPFIPPTATTPLVIRSISYNGEGHPATRKRVIVAAVSQLPLDSSQAVHKLKLLAGPRWSSKPPHNSGIGSEQHEKTGSHGYIKLSCEEFPEPEMNLKWGCDLLDNLLREANNAESSFADIPLDERHLASKARKHRKGEHVRGRHGPRPTLKDFPREWLPS
ncbi:mitochondrial ribosomal subunit protein-domain-containing protein [Hysterangium stoloniferum]|nr:mitochondrial ribosomal subunit protein-domain-containing protein [Hysterangium stoloniferum]